jgi:acyl-CoA thioester hydrolase
MDAMGHVNNTVYFRYVEQARIAWMESLGETFNPVGAGPMLAAAGCNFRIPVVYPATLEVRLYSGSPRRSSFPLYHEIYDAEHPEVLYADGEAVMVWYDATKQVAIPLPEAIRRIIDPLVQTDA